jgi:hypothetical protein
MKSKAVPIETCLEEHYSTSSYEYAFGYNVEEPKRVSKSEAATRLKCDHSLRDDSLLALSAG